MKLFMLFFFAGHVGAYAGPLPYGMDECRIKAVEFQDIANKRGLDARIVCEWLGQPPLIADFAES